MQDRVKTMAVAVLALLVIILAFYLFVFSPTTFVPGQSVSLDQFKGILTSAQTVYIVMDVRGVQDDTTRGNVMQCGVDFSASTFLGSKKNVIPFSFGDTSCFGPQGNSSLSSCASQLSGGTTIYIKGGAPAVQYYSNGMVVSIGKDYKLGGCSITMT